MLTLCVACKKKNPNPAISLVPAISLLQVYPSSVVSHEDSIVFEIEYTDGNGDLGFENADSGVIFITDKRVPLTESYHLPPLTPPGSSIVIQGIIPFVLERTILIDPNSESETVTFDIRIRDRAGNWSNTVTSPTITVFSE